MLSGNQSSSSLFACCYASLPFIATIYSLFSKVLVLFSFQVKHIADLEVKLCSCWTQVRFFSLHWQIIIKFILDNKSLAIRRCFYSVSLHLTHQSSQRSLSSRTSLSRISLLLSGCAVTWLRHAPPLEKKRS